MEKKKRIEENVPTAASFVAGAGVGMASGKAVAQTINENLDKLEIEAVETKDNLLAVETTSANTNANEGPQIEVLSYDTLTTEDEGQMDVAIVSINGHRVLYADVNMDGEANAMVADFNSDGFVDENELIDVTDQHIPMQPFQDVAGIDTSYYAYNDDPDYVNDANVDDFLMA